ncbi:winged helix-turn-helix domain-containing protein [Sphingomonas koreensis]
MADPTRRRLLEELDELDGQTLFDLHVRLVSWYGLAISRQALSKHLGMLEEAGLVRVEWQWRSKHHFLKRAPLRRMWRIWLGPLAERELEEEHVEDRRDERAGR